MVLVHLSQYGGVIRWTKRTRNATLRMRSVGHLKLAIPATLLAHVALASTIHGQGLGKLLIAHALRTCVRESGVIAAHVVLLDARNEHLITYYRK